MSLRRTRPVDVVKGALEVNTWTYRRPFTIQGVDFVVRFETGLIRLRSRLLRGPDEVARDETKMLGLDTDYRNHHLRTTLPNGDVVDVESGYVSWWSAGIAVRVNGLLVYESHPGRTIAWPLMGARGATPPERHSQLQAQAQRDREQWSRNKPSLMVDIALGLLFFIVSKATDNLSTAAIVSAAAGLAIVVAQRFVKVDLLGGLAVFGVFTLLASAGFSLWFQDERMVQLKGSILGALIASIILGDSLFNRGRYFGARMARYIQGATVNPQRLSLGIALMGMTMAILNWAATLWLSKDAWLIYTTFIDAPLALCLALVVFRFARTP